MRLESSIKELHDMFMDIAMLVENQVAGGGKAHLTLRTIDDILEVQ